MRMSHAQLDNLKTGQRFTSENASEYGRRGQIKSTESKRMRKRIGILLKQITDGELTDQEAKEQLIQLGIEDETIHHDAVIAAALYQSAAEGNIPAIERLIEWIDAAIDEISGLGVTEQEQALILCQQNYLRNITSVFGAISVYALKHKYTHFEASGGRGSAKSTWASMTVIRLVMEHPDIHALVLRKVANTLRDSVYTQYLWSIDALGVSEYWEARKSPLELIYRPTGQKIMFRGADDPMKLKSIKAEFGYIGVTHFEEKDQFAGRAEIDNILQSTMRGGTEFWNFETYNPPRSRDNWANKDSAEVKPNRYQHKSSYLDLDDPNWLGEAFLAEAEDLRQRDQGRYQHEYLGIPVGTGGTVFENLELRTITDEEIRHFDHIYQGVDWGWFPDAYAFIRLHYDKTRETIYLIDEHYGNKLTNEQTANWIISKKYDTEFTTCDSAEPKSIADYRSLGVNAKKAEKGPNSVEYGMKWLQRRTIVIDKQRTPHAYEEFVTYEFEQNKAGEWISGYPDHNNHTIDATRYALERVSNKFRSNA